MANRKGRMEKTDLLDLFGEGKLLEIASHSNVLELNRIRYYN